MSPEALGGAARKLRTAARIRQLKPYLFAEIDKKKQAAIAKGVDVISLGIGDPDKPTPEHIVNRLCVEARNPANHRYPAYEGSFEFREAVANWYRRRFGVELDPRSEVMALIGSKEGIAHVIWAYVDPGDYVLVPDPAYPVYEIHTQLAGGNPWSVPLLAENNFLPNFDDIDEEVARKSKLMFLNYPNNPTAGVATLEFFEEAVAFARKYDILICHDAAYTEITFDGYVAPSILQVPGAKEVAVEFNSLSKPFNMTGWRIGMVVGNAEAVGALGIIKTNTDSGQFTAIQLAGVEALNSASPDGFSGLIETYRRRRDMVVNGLNSLGWNLEPPKGSFYVWVPVPEGYTSASFTELLLEKAGVLVTPGSAYGVHGEGYIRISLTVDDSRIAEAIQRLKDSQVRFR